MTDKLWNTSVAFVAQVRAPSADEAVNVLRRRITDGVFEDVEEWQADAKISESDEANNWDGEHFTPTT
jgi:hypothetical protein